MMADYSFRFAFDQRKHAQPTHLRVGSEVRKKFKSQSSWFAPFLWAHPPKTKSRRPFLCVYVWVSVCVCVCLYVGVTVWLCLGVCESVCIAFNVCESPYVSGCVDECYWGCGCVYMDPYSLYRRFSNPKTPNICKNISPCYLRTITVASGPSKVASGLSQVASRPSSRLPPDYHRFPPDHQVASGSL